MKKIVLTGSAYGGKSELLTALSKEGFKVMPEAILQLINESIEKTGIREHLEWKRKNFDLFQQMAAERQFINECSLEEDKENVVLCNRGVHDGIALCRLMHFNVPHRIFELAKRTKYNKVFLVETLSDIELKQKHARILDVDLALKLAEFTKEVYEEFGYQVTNIKDMSLKDRIDFVKRNI